MPTTAALGLSGTQPVTPPAGNAPPDRDGARRRVLLPSLDAQPHIPNVPRRTSS